jgi:hypothetical protein
MGMKKICNSCKEERDAENDFSWEYKSRDIRQKRCKYCQSELSKQHYQDNRQIYNERSRNNKIQRLLQNKIQIHAYLSTHPCADCGQVDIRLLEFDHVQGQKFREIADLFTWGSNWSTLEAEIAKCEIRCANCHRIKSIEQGKGWRSTQPAKQLRYSYQMVRIYLQEHSCVDCGCSDIRVLEFDHVSGQKIDAISHMLSQNCGWPRIKSEIAKCEVRCANCHRIKTIERGGWWRGQGDFNIRQDE